MLSCVERLETHAITPQLREPTRCPRDIRLENIILSKRISVGCDKNAKYESINNDEAGKWSDNWSGIQTAPAWVGCCAQKIGYY